MCQRFGRQAVEVLIALACLPDGLGFHPAGQAVPAMFGEHAGGVVLGIALAVSWDDQLGESGDGTDGGDGMEPVTTRR